MAATASDPAPIDQSPPRRRGDQGGAPLATWSAPRSCCAGPKDIEHLAQLYEEHPELAADRRPGTLIWGGGIIDRELLLVGWYHVP